MDLFDLVKAQLDDATLSQLAKLLGESVQGTQKAVLTGAVPAILGGLAQRYSGEAGAASLLDLLRSGGHDGSMLSNLAGAIGGGAQTDALLNTGKGLLGALLAGRSDAVTDFLATMSGLRRSSAGSLLGLAVPLVLNVIGRQVQARGLKAAGLVGALAAVPAGLGKVAAPGLSAAMGLADFSSIGTAAEAARKSPVWPWLLVPAAALSLFFSLRSCQQTAVRSVPVATGEAAAPTVATPAAPTPAAVAPAAPSPAGTGTPPTTSVEPAPAAAAPTLAQATAGIARDSVAYELAQFLADGTAPVPRSFVLRNLTFDTGTARISGASQATIDAVAQVLKSFGTARLELQGHTDSAGAAASNLSLSAARAQAVQAALVALGIAPERLAAQGFGADRPVADNATPDGRAQNRRTEIVVVAR